MMVGKYILSIDQGTTSSRAVLFDAFGGVAGMGQREFPQIYPQPGYVEHDAVQILQTTLYAMRQAVEGVVAAVSPRLSVHDFRLVRGAKQTKMVFDLAVPYDMTDQRPALKKQIEEALAQQHGEYLTVIRLDGKA